MGRERPDYTTSVNQDFGWKDPDLANAEQAREMTKDLRAHHFEFGNEPADHKTEAALKYDEKSPLPAALLPENPY